MSEQKKILRRGIVALAKYRYGALLAAWCIVIFVMSSVPGNRYPQVSWEYADKLVHVNLYLVGGLLASMWYANRGWRLGFALLFCATYGLSDELHQLMVPRRSFSYGDLAADYAGAGLGVAMYLIINTYRPPFIHKFIPCTVMTDNPERMKTT